MAFPPLQKKILYMTGYLQRIFFKMLMQITAKRRRLR
jgi:hypothetical protein